MEGVQNPDFRWYILQTFSGHERKVREFVEDVVAREGLKHKLGSILIPTQSVFVMRAGKKRTREKTDFPGYMLVQANLDRSMVHVFKEKVFQGKREAIKWLPSRDHPEPIQPDEVRRILGRMDEARESGDKPEMPFVKGDHIRVVDGPFNNFQGVVDEVYADKLKVRVMVSIFGRRTPVELDYLQIESSD